MLMADAVSKLAAKTPGKEAVAMEAFAKALRQVRTCLSFRIRGVNSLFTRFYLVCNLCQFMAILVIIF